MRLDLTFKLSEHIPLYLYRNTQRDKETERQTETQADRDSEGRTDYMEVKQVYNHVRSLGYQNVSSLKPKENTIVCHVCLYRTSRVYLACFIKRLQTHCQHMQ